jgi:hypothetical protein
MLLEPGGILFRCNSGSTGGSPDDGGKVHGMTPLELLYFAVKYNSNVMIGNVLQSNNSTKAFLDRIRLNCYILAAESYSIVTLIYRICALRTVTARNVVNVMNV